MRKWTSGEEPMPTMDEIDELVSELKRCLQGHGPMLQGAALIDIVATYFAGHPPTIRAQLIEDWLRSMRHMIPVNEREILHAFGGKPEGWDAN